MKTMEKLVNRFNRMNPDYHACFHPEWSYRGYYVVYITEPVCGLSSRYEFQSCKEFREWMEGVVLD